MSDELREAEARLLMQRLDHRTRLLAIVTGKREHRTWLRTCLEITVGAAAVSFCCLFIIFTAERSNPVGSLIMLSLFLCLMTLQTEHVNKRMAALIELLQQDGVLQSTLPPSVTSSRKGAGTAPNQDSPETGTDAASTK